MNDLEEMTEIEIKKTIVDKTIRHLQDAGKRGIEGIVLWVGESADSAFQVKDLIFPVQSGFITERGLLVVVEADELYRINKWLFNHKMVVSAQLHTHAGEAYHSTTDDTYPIVTALGGLSIVVPDFASKGFHFDECAVYRLGSSGWCLLDNESASSLIKVVD